MATGDGGREAYTAIAWGVGLSHERSDIAGAKLLVWGEDDGFQTVDYAERYEREIPKTRLVRIKSRALLPRCSPDERHGIAGVEQAIGAVGASLRYLPQYSPDLNPIGGLTDRQALSV